MRSTRSGRWWLPLMLLLAAANSRLLLLWRHANEVSFSVLLRFKCVCVPISLHKTKKGKKRRLLFNQNKSEFNQYNRSGAHLMNVFLFVSLCVLLEIVQFKSIQMIDSDNWPWLVCLTDPCCAEGDMITLFSRLLCELHQCDLSIGWLAGWLDGWSVSWLVRMAGWLVFSLADTKSCGSKNRKMPWASSCWRTIIKLFDKFFLSSMPWNLLNKWMNSIA